MGRARPQLHIHRSTCDSYVLTEWQQHVLTSAQCEAHLSFVGRMTSTGFRPSRLEWLWWGISSARLEALPSTVSPPADTRTVSKEFLSCTLLLQSRTLQAVAVCLCLMKSCRLQEFITSEDTIPLDQYHPWGGSPLMGQNHLLKFRHQHNIGIHLVGIGRAQRPYLCCRAE